MSRARRRGTAVVAALALVTLAAALLASAALASSAGARAVALERAGLVAESAARGALGESLAGWSADADDMAVGAATERALAARDSAGGALAVVSRVRVERLGAMLYAVSVEVRVGGDAPLAQRRVRLLVRRPDGADTTVSRGRPTPIGRWSITDLH